MNPKAGLEAVEERKKLPSRESGPDFSVVQHIDIFVTILTAIPAPRIVHYVNNT